MSHLHFVTNEEARRRVLAMGENPDYVFNFGSPGLDYIQHLEELSLMEIEQSLGFHLRERNLLVTFHPVTVAGLSCEDQVAQLLSALDSFDRSTGLIFTCPNSDPAGRAVRQSIESFVDNHRENAACYKSLGSRLYLNLMKRMNAVVGNSSSGLYEAPTLRVPTVNIGERQEGRMLAKSVISVGADAGEIKAGILQAFQLELTDVVSPYGEGGASLRIKQVIGELPDSTLRGLLKKGFFESDLIKVNQATMVN